MIIAMLFSKERLTRPLWTIIGAREVGIRVTNPHTTNCDSINLDTYNAYFWVCLLLPYADQ